MANMLYKFKIDAPATVNKGKSLEVNFSSLGKNVFRIKRAWISVPDLDALATGDKVEFQISKQSQNESAALYEINDPNEVFTFGRVPQFTQIDYNEVMEQIRVGVEVPGIDGTILTKKNFLTSLITGQDGAIPMYVKILGQPVNTSYDPDEFAYNTI